MSRNDKIKMLLILILGTIIVLTSLASGDFLPDIRYQRLPLDSQGPPLRSHGPPIAAIEVCQGKETGQSVAFVDPAGETIQANCLEVDGRLVAVPERMPPKGLLPR